MSTVSISEKVDSFIRHLDVSDIPFQQSARERLNRLDFPSSRDEYWKYTRLNKISKQTFQIYNDPDRINLTQHIISNDYLVVVNGYIREDLSQYSKLDFEIDFFSADRMSKNEKFDHFVNNNDIFNTLNSAYFEKAISVMIGENKVNKGPLQIIFVTKGENIIANNRLFIDAGKSSQSEVILTFVSKDALNCFTNQVTEAYLGENSRLTVHKVQAESNSNFHVSTEQIHQQKNSYCKINTVTLSGLLVRNNINIQVAGQNCETHMNGAVIGKDTQHVDNHTFVDHQVSNCFSNENYKYVLDDRSTGVFNGRVVVQKDAQVINAYQNNGNILLSGQASINSKPELEIYADDVKCSHGSTTGQLDEEAIFYLQTRGISAENAKKMLVSAFVDEVVGAIENPHVLEYIKATSQDIHGWSI
ncbi:MAG: Fe-S cluster assembly protein SufD [Crocinitomicaceae bacterium]